MLGGIVNSVSVPLYAVSSAVLVFLLRLKSKSPIVSAFVVVLIIAMRAMSVVLNVGNVFFVVIWCLIV